SVVGGAVVSVVAGSVAGADVAGAASASAMVSSAPPGAPTMPRPAARRATTVPPSTPPVIRRVGGAFARWRPTNQVERGRRDSAGGRAAVIRGGRLVPAGRAEVGSG